jgi:MoxR-like ATPase
LLSDYQITIPELGTVRAKHAPHVLLTSNRSRELSDALRRRCLYQWIDYPSLEKEMKIVRTRLPAIEEKLARQVAKYVHAVRGLNLSKPPGVAETLDCAQALLALGKQRLDGEAIDLTMGSISKSVDDTARIKSATVDKLLVVSDEDLRQPGQ